MHAYAPRPRRLVEVDDGGVAVPGVWVEPQEIAAPLLNAVRSILDEEGEEGGAACVHMKRA